MLTADEALALYGAGLADELQFVDNWRAHIPAGSRWFPGCPGDPQCKECEGTGYLRLEVPIGHPAFGKAFLCSCARQHARPERG